MKISAIGASVAVIVASVASADVTYTFVNQTWTEINFTEAFGAGTLTGTLTAVKANATLNAQVENVDASDLCVYINPSPWSQFGLLQVGGSNTLSAGQWYLWGNGGSSAPGTVVSSTKVLTTGINMTANPTQSIWVGNGYGIGSGTWTGTITLVGVDLAPVPAPGAVALLGLAGAIGGRRRRA